MAEETANTADIAMSAMVTDLAAALDAASHQAIQLVVSEWLFHDGWAPKMAQCHQNARRIASQYPEFTIVRGCSHAPNSSFMPAVPS